MKVVLFFVGLAAVFAPYQYYTNGPTDAFNVVFACFLLLWLTAWAYAELHRARLAELEEHTNEE